MSTLKHALRITDKIPVTAENGRKQRKTRRRKEHEKIFAILTVLCLILTTAALAEEGAEKTYADEHPGVLAFDSYWVSDDAQIRIDARHADDGYEIVVTEMTGENTFNSWEYLLEYDEATKSLVANGNGMKSANVFDETGTIRIVSTLPHLFYLPC